MTRRNPFMPLAGTALLAANALAALHHWGLVTVALALLVGALIGVLISEPGETA